MSKFYLKGILNRCRCGKVCECLLLGKETKKGDKPVKILGVKCNHCGLVIEASIDEYNKLTKGM